MLGAITRFFVSIAIAIEKAIAVFHKPECLISWDQMQESKALLVDGDILCSRTDYELSNIFIPGPYKHCGVYINGLVYEATTNGVRTKHWEEWALKRDHIGICRPAMEYTDLDLGIIFLKNQLGRPYDYDFLDLGNSKAWYCSEYAYKFLCISIKDFDHMFTLRKTLGQETVAPSDYWNAAGVGKFKIIGTIN